VRFSLIALSALLCSSLLVPGPLAAAKADKKDASKGSKKTEKEESKLSSATLSGLAFRNIGPALTSGRIIDIAVDPTDDNTIFLAVAAGGVWKTTNHGVTWTPVFDGEGSYSIGCVVIDPKNPNVVWVGSGENNSQRSVGYGDGVYKSLDGGTSWQKMGLEQSEHIGKIVIDPRDSNVVYVAAQGPLWSPGGDRGLYKTMDGGKTWNRVLDLGEHTGASDLLVDPRDPDVLIVSAYQRRRHVFTVINGGPEGGIHKSTDGGKTWRKLKGGLPGGDIGRIGLAQSGADHDVVYAIVEAADKGGFYRSTNLGETWEKRSSYVSGSGQYYQEIFADPNDVDRVISADVFSQITHDGGATWSSLPEDLKHVDNHAFWIDPADSRHILNGNDGGFYETWDSGANWQFFGNLPVTQFYRVAVSNDKPFYYVYGGTQDNFTLGGPSRTLTEHGIANSDWFVTVGGDGFQSQVDPEIPSIVYSQSQYGNLQRFDRKSGEATDIMPQPAVGEPELRWNWDSPVIISPHKASRLYFAANKLFRSENRGDAWTAISPDLTRQLDRNKIPVMGKIWPVDSIAKSRSTSPYGNIVALAESPKQAGLLFVGTDDGLVQISEDDGATWRKTDSFPGVPVNTYVSDLFPSEHDADVVFAAFNNHKNGDFKPYLLRSDDRGKTWTSIAANLPERGSTWTVAQDPVRRDLLFVGTEFGIFTSIDYGKRWLELEGGVPTIAVRDMVIHKRDHALVLATFGRGFLVLDDLGPLRQIDETTFEQGFVTFPVPQALAYNPALPLGMRGKAFAGASYFLAPNPEFGAKFTYYLKDGLKSLKDQRRDAEKKIDKDKGTHEIPSWEALRAEAAEDKPTIIATVRDSEGHVVRRLTGPTGAGIQSIQWDLRYPPPDAVNLEPGPVELFSTPPRGPAALPGSYTVSFQQMVNGKLSDVGQPQTFEVVPVGALSLPAPDRRELLAFHQKSARLARALEGAIGLLGELDTRVQHLEKAAIDTPNVDLALRAEVERVQGALRAIRVELFGDSVLRRYEEPVPPAVAQRIGRVIEGSWGVTSAPTKTQEDGYRFAAEAFEKTLADLKVSLGEVEALETKLEKAGAPWTPGRLPEWKIE
jgi:photosystem II stability/assembly factor-like uncharacterized protein